MGAYNGTTGKIFVDGANENSSTVALTYDTATTLTVGGLPFDVGTNACQCQIDEARVRSDYIADGRVTADFNNQSSPWTFYTWGTPVLLVSSVRHRVINQ